MRRYLIAFVLSATASAGVQSAPPERNVYGSEVGAVYGALRSVKEMSDTCTDVFPEMKEKQFDALLRWRNEYSDFIEEIEDRFLQLMFLDAEQEESRYRAAVAELEEGLEKRRTDQRRKLVANQYEKLKAECENFPELLQSKQVNMELRFSEQVRRIREAVPIK